MVQHRGVRAFMFDLFGTVIAYGDIEAGTLAAWRGIYDVLTGLGALVTFEEFTSTWQAQFVTPLAPGDPGGETVFLRKLLRLFRHWRVPEDRAAARTAAARCLTAWDAHMALPPDSTTTLDALRQRGYRTALVTNFDHPPFVRALLRRFELENRFDAIVISGDTEWEKPDPHLFHLALDALGCQPEETIFVGDSLEADVAGSAAVGCRPVLIDRMGTHQDYLGLRLQDLSPLVRLADAHGARLLDTSR